MKKFLSVFPDSNPSSSAAAAQSTEVHKDSIPTRDTATGGFSWRWSAKQFAVDSSGLHFYTGLENYAKFLVVLDSLDPTAYHFNYYGGMLHELPVEDQFLLTLI